jgi:hypothetical protein
MASLSHHRDNYELSAPTQISSPAGRRFQSVLAVFYHLPNLTKIARLLYREIQTA